KKALVTKSGRERANTQVRSNFHRLLRDLRDPEGVRERRGACFLIGDLGDEDPLAGLRHEARKRGRHGRLSDAAFTRDEDCSEREKALQSYVSYHDNRRSGEGR